MRPSQPSMLAKSAFMRAYISELDQAASLASLFAHPPVQNPSLHDRFVQWYAVLPPLARNRPFAMVEIERALGAPGRLISQVAIRLGWRRTRIWTGAGPFHRYWLPPEAQAAAAACGAAQAPEDFPPFPLRSPA